MPSDLGRCSKIVYRYASSGHLCPRNAKNIEAEQGWCTQHTPSLVEDRRKARNAAWNKAYQERNARRDEERRREEHDARLVACVRAHAWHYACSHCLELMKEAEPPC